MRVPISDAQRAEGMKEPDLSTVFSIRRSSRAYLEKRVEDEKISALFEAARWSPSAMNEQPWVFVYADAQESPLHKVIAGSLNASNRVWAEKAPVLIVSIARQRFDASDKLNPAALHDTGMANLALTLKATALGLNAHMMGGFNGEHLAGELGLDENMKPVVVIAIGYPGEIEHLPEALQQREKSPRNRKTQSEFVFNQPFNT